MLRPLLIFVFATTILFSCSDSDPDRIGRKVRIIKENGKYNLYKNNKIFHIKGASGSANLRLINQLGGNTIRIWDTTHLAAILDSARTNDISVIVGLPVSNSSEKEFYSNPAKMAAQQQAYTKLVKRFRSHDALLMWCVGNELDFPINRNDKNFYKSFNALTDMIHSLDPDHPVTTTVLNFNTKYIANLQVRCDIDLISFNIFGQLYLLREDLKNFSWFWRGPFMILEWGIDGPWQGTEQTAWSAYIELASKEKAEIYRHRYLDFMPTESNRFVGAFVFFWGYKQETTHTWFSIFDRQGAKSQPVSTMKYIWTGKALDETFPAVSKMLVDQRGARDNILLTPRQQITAEVILAERKDSIKTIQWEIYREDWFKKNNNENSTKFQNPLPGLLSSSQSLKASFTTPAEEGPYRIFATVYDYKGNFATCNVPFYVLSTK